VKLIITGIILFVTLLVFMTIVHYGVEERAREAYEKGYKSCIELKHTSWNEWEVVENEYDR
jgi:hypothetical protein